MDTISFLFGHAGNILNGVVHILFALTVVIFIHELGHFLVARWCGVAVKTFSIGFGREIFGFHDRHGTRWRVAWIPLGGYVKFIDDENAASAGQIDPESLPEELRQKTFQSKPLGQRAAIVAAGPIANFILAIAIYTAIFSIVGERILVPRVDMIKPGSAAEQAGFKPGDLIVSIDGSEIDNFTDMQQIVALSPDQPLEFVVDRDGDNVSLTAVPVRTETEDRFGNKVRLGQLGIQRNSSPEDDVLVHYNPAQALVRGVKECHRIFSMTFGYLYDVVRGRQSADQLAGPIGIAKLTTQVAAVSFLAFIGIVAFLSFNIGLVNLFPIPILDGGHLMFYAIEAVRGRPLSETTQEIAFRIGLVLILMLMVFVTWNDVT